MGTGKLDGGRIDLTVSLRFTSDQGVRKQWEASFRHASSLLFDATDGQHQFGTISVCDKSGGSDTADFWLQPTPGRSEVPLADVGAIGHKNAHGLLCADEQFRPLIILHEFAHYAYGVRDEYQGPGHPKTQCIGGTTSDACIMEARWQDGDRFGEKGAGGPLVTGRITEFCVSANHDTVQPNSQQTFNKKSCWETMADAGLHLVAPQGLPTGPAPAGAAEITWNLLPPDQRFVLVVDRSLLLADDGDVARAAEEVRLAADWWAEAALIGDTLGIVSFGATARTEAGPITITGDQDRAVVHSAIADLQSGTGTSLGAGLRAGLAVVRAAGPRSANQVLVLVTDGLQDGGEDPHNVLPDLVDHGVQVFVVGVGPTVDDRLLQEIATATSGVYHRVDPTLSRSHQGLRLRTVLQQFAEITHDNVAVVTARHGTTGRQDPVVHHVVIEPECVRATFGVTWIGPENAVLLRLIAPDDTVIVHGALPTGVREIAGPRPDAAFQVDHPAAGVWQVEIHSSADEVDHQLFVTSEHIRIDGLLRAAPGPYRPGDVIPLFLRVNHDRPVTGLTVRGVVRIPGGGVVALRLSDDADPRTGDEDSDDGVYSALFTDTQSPGTYTVEVEVQSDEMAARHPGSGEPPDPDEPFPSEPVPFFHRRYEATLVVG